MGGGVDSASAEFPLILVPDLVTLPSKKKLIKYNKAICKMTITATLSFQVPDYDVRKAAFLLDKTDRKEAGLHATPYQELG